MAIAHMAPLSTTVSVWLRSEIHPTSSGTNILVEHTRRPKALPVATGSDSVLRSLGWKPNGRRNTAILLGRVDGLEAQYSGLWALVESTPGPTRHKQRLV